MIVAFVCANDVANLVNSLLGAKLVPSFTCSFIFHNLLVAARQINLQILYDQSILHFKSLIIIICFKK